MRALGRVLARLRAFGALLGWLVGLLLRSARRQTATACLLSLLGTVTHVAAIGIFLSFVHAQTSGGVLSVGPLELPATTELGSLAVWSAAVLLMAFLTAAASYRSAVLAFEAARRAARSFLRQALTVLTGSQLAHNELLSRPEGRDLARRAFFGDSVVLLRTAVVGIGLLAPLLLFLVALAALLRLDISLTAGIAIPLALFAVPFWRHNRQVVAAAREYKQLIAQRSRGLKGVFDYVSQTHAAEHQAPAMLDAALDDPATAGFERTLGRIMLRGHRVTYLKLLFLGVVLCGLLFAWGAFQSSGSGSWSALVTYVVALQYAVSTMGAVAAAITGVARYVPYLERMRALTTEGPSPSRPLGSRPIPVARAPEPRLPGSAAERRLDAGDVLACLYAPRLDAFSVPAFLEKLTGSRREAAELASQTFFCGSPSPPPGWPGDPESLAGADLDPGARRLLEGIVPTEGPAGGEPGREVLSYALLLVPGLAARRRVFVLEWWPLRELGREGQAAILDLLRERVTILVQGNLPSTAPRPAGAVAIVDDRRTLGLGDRAWYAGLDHEHPLLEGFRDRAEKPDAAPDEELDDEALFG